jgi:hypothetical protein
MSDETKNTKNTKNTKRLFKIVGTIGLIVAIAGAGAVGGYSYGSKGANAEAETETAEVNEVRNTITVEEDAEGEILINGKGFEPNGVTLGEGRIFLERVPVNCKETTSAMRVLMRKGDIAAVLNPDQRYEFELLNVLAKDVCSYEEYRNLLISGLSEFLYTAPGTGTAEGATETTVPGEGSTVPDEAGDQPTTTAPEDQ